MTFPSSLQTLTFGRFFNHSLVRVAFPSSLHSLTFGHDFNQSLKYVTFPPNLQAMTGFARACSTCLLSFLEGPSVDLTIGAWWALPGAI